MAEAKAKAEALVPKFKLERVLNQGREKYHDLLAATAQFLT